MANSDTAKGALAVIMILATGVFGFFLGSELNPQTERVPGPTVTETVTETVSATVTDKVPTIPQACFAAVSAGRRSWQLYGQLEDAFLDAYNTVDDAYNAGANGESSNTINSILSGIEQRYNSISNAAGNVPFFVNAEKCE